jgi:GT2 family glycosyltransferase
MVQAGSLSIDIVIPNWNGRQMLETCLASLERQSSQGFSVTVIDNGSNDGSVEFVRQRYPNFKLLCFLENQGFSVAVNAGISASDTELVLLLNNDTELDERCIEILLETGAENDAEMFALKMLDFNDRQILDGAGDGVLRGGVGYRLGTMEHDGERYGLRREVFGACGGAAVYRRSLLDRIGLFDEDFFAYLEDVDLNMRAVRGGARCCFLPDARVYHIGSGSSGSKINSFTVKLSTRNNLFVAMKNYSLATWFRFLPAFLVYQLFWLLFVVKKGQLPAYLSGLAAALPHLVKMGRKGLDIRDRSVLSEAEFRAAVIEAERQVLGSIMARRTQYGKGNRALQFYLRIFC